jgi:hypothetical protein
MAHHSSEGLPPEFRAFFGKTVPGLGATGQFPLGKITDNDEGELRMAVTHHEGKVVIDFGKPTAWIGFTPEQADDIADLLRKHAKSARFE